ncbi:hypothetical protein ACFLSS_03150 [Bacteroidota bacterium]
MGISKHIVTNNPRLKRIGECIIISEYETGKIKFANIAIDRNKKSVSDIYEELEGYLLESDFTIINQFLFGMEKHEINNRRNAKKYFNGLKWPVTVIKQEPLNGDCEWGSIISAVSNVNLSPIIEDTEVIGNYFEDDYAGYYIFGGLTPGNSGESNIQQSRHSFEILEKSLGNLGMDIYNLARTWFYLDDLLSWYDDFNVVRNEYFRNKGVLERVIPASTGIGAANLKKNALLIGGYAMRQKQNGVEIIPVDSPYQCPASDYKSSFSRAVEIIHPEYRHLIISGTASITSDGESAHIGDIDKQVEMTMKVVQGILNSREMTWENVTRGVAYIKNRNDINSLNKFCIEKNLPLLPLSTIQADICRDELLFEIEVDAVSINKI